MNDTGRVQACLARRPGAWEEFVRHTAPKVLYVIRKILRTASDSDREDVLQDVYAALVAKNYKLLRDYKREYALTTWLGVIARTRCREFLRRNKPHAPLVSDPAAPEPQMPPENLTRFLGELPDRDRQVLEMFYLDGKKHREIGETIGVPVTSVGQILARARLKILRVIKGKAND